MNGVDLPAIAKAHKLLRIGVNLTDFTGAYRYLCEVWADDVAFASDRGATPQAAIKRALAEISRLRAAKENMA